ncbi:hypothetical protein KEJ25_09420 [Candidatus Bathyarchaeota archaeon]|nr:hypothetical protein [Candidatus Bathyarchaeota archaeon]
MKKQCLKTVDSRIVEKNVSEVVIECMGRETITIIVFAEENDNEVLRLHALKGLKLEVDPIIKRLKEVEAVLA